MPIRVLYNDNMNKETHTNTVTICGSCGHTMDSPYEFTHIANTHTCPSCGAPEFEIHTVTETAVEAIQERIN